MAGCELVWREASSPASINASHSFHNQQKLCMSALPAPTPPHLHAGALPDQLEFSRDCRTILVSNEGEPRTYTPASLANDPEGSVSVINLHFCESSRVYDAYAAANSRTLLSEGSATDKYASEEKEEAVEPERHAKHSHRLAVERDRQQRMSRLVAAWRFQRIIAGVAMHALYWACLRS